MTFLIVLAIVAAILIIGLFVLYGFYRKIHRTFFGRRQPVSDLPYVPTYHDYEDFLEREQFLIDPGSPDFLQGYFYRQPKTKTFKGLIVVAHGFQADHTRYLPEIRLFAEAGFLVYAFDNLGNGESGGRSQISLYRSAIDLNRVLKAVKLSPYRNLPLGLYGHSWGGFAVLAVNNFRQDIKAVCARSGFETESQTILDGLYKFHPLLTSLLRPWAGIFAFLTDGKKSLLRASTGVKKAKDTRFLIFHARNDRLVRFRHSAAHALLKGTPPHVSLKVYPDGGHSLLYLAASKKIRQTAKKAYEELCRKYGQKWPDAIAADYRKQFPLDKLYATEPKMTAAILDFFEKNLV